MVRLNFSFDFITKISYLFLVSTVSVTVRTLMSSCTSYIMRIMLLNIYIYGLSEQTQVLSV
jgi:hypothetical protein